MAKRLTAAERQMQEWGGQSLGAVLSGPATTSSQKPRQQQVEAPQQSAAQSYGIGKTSASHFLANRTRGKPTAPTTESQDDKEFQQEQQMSAQQAFTRKPAPVKKQQPQAAAANHAAAYNNEDVFAQTTNPFALEEQKQRAQKGKQAPNVRKYERPDPSKKQRIDQDTPIRVNPTGQYNLNFIDWDNEWEAIMDRDPNSYESPIDGMSAETFEAIYDEEMFDEMQSRGIKGDCLANLDTRTVQKTQKENICAICVVQYRRGDKVFFLGCKHHFHTDCVTPWLRKNSICPLCRFDINKKVPAGQAADIPDDDDEEENMM